MTNKKLKKLVEDLIRLNKDNKKDIQSNEIIQFINGKIDAYETVLFYLNLK